MFDAQHISFLKTCVWVMLWGSLAGIGVYNTFFEIDGLNLVLYAVMCKEKISALAMPISWGIGIGVVAIMFAVAQKVIPGGATFAGINKAMRPLLLMLLVFLLPIDVYSTYIFIAISGITLFRYWLLFPPKTGASIPTSGLGRWAWVPIIGLTVVFVLYGFYLQKVAFDTAYLCWADWGYFYESLQNTLAGKWFWLNILHVNFLGSRFCPGLVILLPYMKVFGSPYAFFLMSSVVLSSGGIMVYLLCRGLKFSAWESMIFGMIYFFIPGFFNMNLCLVYSFHEIYFTIPTVLAAFYFYEKRKYIPAVLFLLFSMTFQETVPVLWIGFGLVALVQRRFRLAVTLILVSLAYYYFANHIAIPYCRGAAHYTSMFRYSHLGSTAGDIITAPFIRPDAFWGSLFRPGTFYFLTILLLPVFILTLSYPLGLGAAGIVMVFLCIEGTDQTQNIMRHYQTMILEVIILNTLYCYRRLKDGKISPWLKLLAGKIINGEKCINWRGAVLAATLFTAALSFLVYANTHFSKNPVPDFNSFSDFRPAARQFAELIPAGAKLTASSRMAAIFCSRNDVFQDLDPVEAKYPLQEYILIDLLDPMNGDMMAFRNRLLQSGDYGLVRSYSDETHFVMLIKRGAKTDQSKSVRSISAHEWQRIGTVLGVNDSRFSARMAWGTAEKTAKTVQILVRVESRVEEEVVFRIGIFGQNRTLLRSCLFGNGWDPVTVAQAGDVYCLDVDVPAGFIPVAAALNVEKIKNGAPQ